MDTFSSPATTYGKAKEEFEFEKASYHEEATL